MKIISAEQYNRFKADTWLPLQNFLLPDTVLQIVQKNGE